MTQSPQPTRMCPCEERRMFRTITFPQIRAAAAANPPCRLCAAFQEAIIAVVDGGLPSLYTAPTSATERDRILESITVKPPRFLDEKIEKELSLVIGKDPTQYITILLFRDKNPSFTLRGFQLPKANRFEASTNSSKTFDRAKGWLDECRKHHQCQISDLDGRPGRLLDIGGDCIRLIDKPGSGVQYACLSHRWGKTRPLTTVRTIGKHKERIPYNDLPQTFKDAVTIARRMDVDYLWIDALCILQEIRVKPNESQEKANEQEKRQQEEDWQLENSKMAAIYRKSLFTISADMCVNSDSFIFSKDIKDLEIKVTDDKAKKVSFYIREDKNHWGKRTELEKRGWTFQEFLLPPRVLHFGEFDIIWRCRESHTCECGQINGAAGWRKWLGELAKSVPADDYDAREHWEDIVSNYSTRELGRSKDKLPALSGLAQVFRHDRQEQKKDANYLAGLWREWLVQGLCWYSTVDYSFPLRFALGSRPMHEPENKGEPQAKYQIYRAPTWSWAAVELDNINSESPRTAQHRFWVRGKHAIHPIHPCGQQRQVCIVEGAECTTTWKDPTGAVERGYIKLSGWPIAAKIAHDKTGSLPWTIEDIEDGTTVRFCMPDCKADAKVGDAVEIGTEVRCMPILEALSERRSERGCLILRLYGEGTYKRVGFCILMKENRIQERQQELRKANLFQADFTKPELADKVKDFALSLDGVATSFHII